MVPLGNHGSTTGWRPSQIVCHCIVIGVYCLVQDFSKGDRRAERWFVNICAHTFWHQLTTGTSVITFFIKKILIWGKLWVFKYMGWYHLYPASVYLIIIRRAAIIERGTGYNLRSVKSDIKDTQQSQGTLSEETTVTLCSFKHNRI